MNEKKREVINPSFVKRCRSIMENLKNTPQIDKDGLFQRALAQIDNNPLDALNIIYTNQQCGLLFDDHLLQFNTWFQTFNKLVQQTGKAQELKGFNIQDKLISLQPKIKAKIPHSSYSLVLMSVVKKDLKLDDQFMNKWRDYKRTLKQERQKKNQQQKQRKRIKMQQQQQSQSQPQPQQSQQQTKLKQQGHNQLKIKQQPQIKSKPQQKQKQLQAKVKQEIKSAQPKIELNEVIPQSQQKNINQIKLEEQRQRQKQKQKERDKQIDLQKSKKLQQRFKQIQRMKSANQSRFKKNKDFRQTCLIKYLQNRKQFSFGASKQTIAKQILQSLERFMKDKVQKMLKVSKMRLPRYTKQEAGDQFKMYSNKSTYIKLKSAVLLPQSDIKILKLQYPSKPQQYLKLRVEEERQQQKFKNEFKQRIDTDKKTDKVVQSYILSQQKQNVHQYKRDEGPKKRERLLVSSQVIQYIIQTDPWFCDSFAMQKSFYRESG